MQLKHNRTRTGSSCRLQIPNILAAPLAWVNFYNKNDIKQDVDIGEYHNIVGQTAVVETPIQHSLKTAAAKSTKKRQHKFTFTMPRTLRLLLANWHTSPYIVCMHVWRRHSLTRFKRDIIMNKNMAFIPKWFSPQQSTSASLNSGLHLKHDQCYDFCCWWSSLCSVWWVRFV